MMRTGMTLLEMLLAIALLSVIVMATAAWAQIAAEITSPTGRIEHERTLSVINTALDLIQHDLETGDFNPPSPPPPPPPPPPDGKRENTQPRVTIEAGSLAIDTRAPGIGATRHEYRFDAVSNEVVIVESADGGQISRVLLDHVQSWNCRPDAEHQQFDVTVQFVDGGTLSRRYLCP